MKKAIDICVAIWTILGLIIGLVRILAFPEESKTFITKILKPCIYNYFVPCLRIGLSDAIKGFLKMLFYGQPPASNRVSYSELVNWNNNSYKGEQK